MKSYITTKSALAVALLSASAASFAALPTGVATAFTAVQSDASDLFDLAVPVVVAILGMMVVIKLIKRFGNKF